MQHGLGSLRGAIGTPTQIAELVRRYEAVGVDQVVFVLQAGANKHEHICEALELFGREVLPAFAGRARRPRTREGRAPRPGGRTGAGAQGGPAAALRPAT